MNVTGIYLENNKCLEHIGIDEVIKSPPLFLIFIESKHEMLLKLFLGLFGFIDGLLVSIPAEISFC